MLMLDIPESEYFDESTNSFIKVKAMTIQLEHSLVSLSKWESKWKKPFLTSNKTVEETIDYIRCMTITHGVPDYVYLLLANVGQMKKITEYIEDPMTATTFPLDASKKINKKIITAELIYFWMIASQIPFECRKWHLNKLLTLIRVCGDSNSPPKNMSKKEIYAQNRSLNAARRARLKSKG